MNESKKRDFISQMIGIVENNQASLTQAGFDPATQLTGLKTNYATANAAEVSQQEAKAAQKRATELAVQTLDVAYKQASNFADLISGLYGKDDAIVQEIRKMRK